MATLRLSLKEAKNGVRLHTGGRHTIVIVFPKLTVRLNIDPHQASSLDDQFILRGNGPGPAVEETQTVKHDQVPGDQRVDLIFSGLRPGYRYTLLVAPGGEGEAYPVFEDVAVEELVEI